MKQLPQLELNEVLSEAAAKELPNFRGKSSYKKYRRADNIGNIVPDYYLVASPAMVADDGADEPINVLTKILLDKQDRLKDGRDILCDPKFTQVGIAHEIFDEENMVILIFATEYIEDEPDYELPEGDLSELKQAFDILDTEGKEKLNMKEVMRSMDDLEFYKTNPTLYSILKDVSDKEKCSWPKFAYFANARMTERDTKEGLSRIFNLFIDNPDKGTITFETFRRICNEIDCGLSDLQLKEILEKATNNGNEITFKEFQEYMLLPSQNK
jgi:Ca2+-binding EF-hand superfamily protein